MGLRPRAGPWHNALGLFSCCYYYVITDSRALPVLDLGFSGRWFSPHTPSLAAELYQALAFTPCQEGDPVHTCPQPQLLLLIPPHIPPR